MTLFERIMMEKRRLESELANIEQQLTGPPEGCLMCHRNGRSFKYYQRIPNKSNPGKPTVRYLNKRDDPLKSALALKTVLQRRKADTVNELKAIHSYLSLHKGPESQAFLRINQSPGLQKLLYSKRDAFPCASLSEELKICESQEYPTKQDHSENKIFQTEKEDNVRSKSEMLIAHLLYSNNIPYRYECRLILNYSEMYPDFTIRHPETGEIYIWEHFGLMDDPEYVQTVCRKIRKYIENGFIPGKNLIMTFESEKYPFDFTEVQNIIREKFL